MSPRVRSGFRDVARPRRNRFLTADTKQYACFTRGGVEPNPFVLYGARQIDSSPTFLRGRLGCSQANLQSTKLKRLLLSRKQGGQSALPGKRIPAILEFELYAKPGIERT